MPDDGPVLQDISNLFLILKFLIWAAIILCSALVLVGAAYLSSLIYDRWWLSRRESRVIDLRVKDSERELEET